MNQPKIELNGAEPTKDLMQYIQLQLESLESQSPEQSFISMTLSKEGSVVSGELRINSQAKSFFTHAQDDSLAGVVMDLIQQTERKIRGWKALRFTPLANALQK